MFSEDLGALRGLQGCLETSLRMLVQSVFRFSLNGNIWFYPYVIFLNKQASCSSGPTQHIRTSPQPVNTSLFLSFPGGQGVAFILQSPHQCLLLSHTP